MNSPERFDGGMQIPHGFRLPTYQPNKIVHILLGDYPDVMDAINRMEVLGYADRLAWFDPIPTGRNGEHISIMSRRAAPRE